MILSLQQQIYVPIGTIWNILSSCIAKQKKKVNILQIPTNFKTQYIIHSKLLLHNIGTAWRHYNYFDGANNVEK